MPSRGQYWKVGGINDQHVVEADLDQTLQTKINAVGFFSTFGFSKSSANGTESYDPFFSFTGIANGDQSAVFPKAGNITSMHVNLTTSGSGTNVVVTPRINGTPNGTTLSFSPSGTGVTSQTTAIALSALDKLDFSIDYSGVIGTIAGRITIEYDFS